MDSTSLRTRRAVIGSVLATLALSAVVSAPPAWSSSSHVLPASAKPHGYSLTDMAAAVAPFTISGNDPALYPNTPFQILYITEYVGEIVDGGFVATGGKTFTTSVRTRYYVPVINYTNIGTVVGDFPTTAAEAAFYFFDDSRLGASLQVIVDGVATTLGPEYLAGPVQVGDTDAQIVTLGVFLPPLRPGTHTVILSGGFYGDAVAEEGVTYIEEHFTYTVHVLPGN
jgi:hypothetical protein